MNGKPRIDTEYFLKRRVREYVFQEVLGCGGMGAVYKAFHTRLKADRAIKILPPELASNVQFKARFEKEAQILARLSNPYLTQVYEFFEENNHLFLVMEFVKGDSLSDVLQYTGIMNVERAVKFVRQACTGLAHAHGQGIVHRDLSPDNIMLQTATDGSETIKIIDFGIAKTEPRVSDGSESSSSSNLTNPGVFIGKPQYCSPEQAVGDPIDPRSDQYSLALILFEALTGVPVFQGSTNLELLTIRVHNNPPRLNEANPELTFTDELEQVIDKALAREPFNRFPDVISFSLALQQAVSTDDHRHGEKFSHENAHQTDSTKDQPLKSDGSDPSHTNNHNRNLQKPKTFPTETSIKSVATSSGTPPQSSSKNATLNLELEEPFATFTAEQVKHSKQIPSSHWTPPTPIKRKPRRDAYNLPNKKQTQKRWLNLLSIGLAVMLGVSGGFCIIPNPYRDTCRKSIRSTIRQATGIVQNLHFYNDKSKRVDPAASQKKPVPPLQDRSIQSNGNIGSETDQGPYLASRRGIIPPEILTSSTPDIPAVLGNVTLPVKVIVQAVILKDGKVGSVTVMNQGDPDFDQAAMNLIKTWTFQPGTLNGEPADIILDIPVSFDR